MRKVPLISICIIALVAFAIWAPNASAQSAIEAVVEAPGVINGARQGIISVGIQFVDEDFVEISELICGGNVSTAQAMPENIFAQGGQNKFTTLFRVQDLMLVCDDTEIYCYGTLADGTAFAGMDGIRVIRDLDGQCN